MENVRYGGTSTDLKKITEMVERARDTSGKAAASYAIPLPQNLQEKSDFQPVIGFIRVSTNGQSEDGNSLVDQENQIRSYASQHRHRLHALYEEIGSGRHKRLHDRPELEQALITSRDTGYPIITTAMSRLGRDTALLVEELLNKGISLIITTLSNPCPSKAVFIVEAKDAQREGKRIARSTRNALSDKPGMGSPSPRNGGVVRGDQFSSETLEFRVTMMAAVQEMEHAAGHALSDNAIAKIFNDRGIGTFTGKPWRRETVRDLRRDTPAFILE